MAQRTIVTLVDDLDGSEAAETVEFGLDGRGYEIDLSAANAAALRNALRPFVPHARPIPAAPRQLQVTHSYDPAAVRVWGRQNGVDVPQRGRIPVAIVEQFYAAGH